MTPPSDALSGITRPGTAPARIPRQAVGISNTALAATGALAIGAVAVGALALGALAVGRLAIGSLMLRAGHVRRLRIDDLTVVRFEVIEVLSAEGVITPPASRSLPRSPRRRLTRR